jgi:GST-like protein
LRHRVRDDIVCGERIEREGSAMIEVWTWPTPNGHKVHIALEELGIPYKVIPINIGAGDQFKPEFLKITPNHRIPAIVDPDGPGGKPFTLFESAAIMIYLSDKTGGRLIPKDPIGHYKCLEWIMFQRLRQGKTALCDRALHE